MYMNRDGQSKNPGLKLRLKKRSAIATVASSSGRASVCGRPKSIPQRRRTIASVRIAASAGDTARALAPTSATDQALKGLADLDVLLVSALVHIELLSLDRIDLRASHR